MSSTVDLHDEVASQLFAAYSSRDSITPPREIIDKLNLSGAYRIQRWQQQAFEEQGHKVIGHKIGLTSLAMQKQLGVKALTSDSLPIICCWTQGSPLQHPALSLLKSEPELAFRLKPTCRPMPPLSRYAARSMKSPCCGNH